MTAMTIVVRAAAALAAAAVLPAPASYAMAPRVSLEVRGPGAAYHVEGVFSAPAPPETAWSVITDYDGIGRFVRSIVRSRVLSRGAGKVVLEQDGSGRFFFIRRRVALKLAVDEMPPFRVDFHELEGPFTQYAGSWRIVPSQAGCLVFYELTAEPGPALKPAFAAKAVLRRNVQDLLGQVRAEILRRAAATGGSR